MVSYRIVLRFALFSILPRRAFYVIVVTVELEDILRGPDIVCLLYLTL